MITEKVQPYRDASVWPTHVSLFLPLSLYPRTRPPFYPAPHHTTPSNIRTRNHFTLNNTPPPSSPQSHPGQATHKLYVITNSKIPHQSTVYQLRGTLAEWLTRWPASLFREEVSQFLRERVFESHRCRVSHTCTLGVVAGKHHSHTHHLFHY